MTDAARSCQGGLTVVDSATAVDEDSLLRSEQVLEPGYFWTAKCDIPVASRPDVVAGDTLLLVDLIEFEDKLHSVELLIHPRHGASGRYVFLIDAFVRDFAPCSDADSIRAAEQQGILDDVAALQREIVETQSSPQRMLEAVKPQVDQDEARRTREETEALLRRQNRDRDRERNLSKIHRRAARRSSENGNPLALPRVAVGTNVSQLLNAGIDEGGVVQLREIADRQLVLAQAQANWLTTKTEEIGKKLKQLAPYASEKAAVALARSSDAVKRAEKIKQGIESLDLYTGKGVDVFEVRDGPEAGRHVPLRIVQGKRYMDEELASHADIEETFDWRDQGQFFAELAKNQALLDQVFPTDRCVVSMAVTRHQREYKDAWSAMIHSMQNQLVFLLVRNGGKVHVVYSGTPSHEAASRLFPTRNELGDLFTGIDGSTITLRDVEFGERSKRFDDLALHYRRFLILLCGLDHRLRLFGEFYPPEEQIRFMTADFQARFMDFYADDETSNLLDDGMPWVTEWMLEKNKMVQSGSRVFVTNSTGASINSPEMRRRHGLRFLDRQFESPLFATQEGHRHLVTLETRDSWSRGGREPNVKCYLDGKDEEGNTSTWWLCLDGVKPAEIQRYLSSRRNWAMGVSYLRLFRRLVVYLSAEAVVEAPAREYLMAQATTHGGMPADVAAAAMDVAVRNWRAARRGAALPGLDDPQALNDILSLMAPPGYIPPAIAALFAEYLHGPDTAEGRRQPLLLTRVGPGRYALYTTAAAVDCAAYPNVLQWGWVRRVVLEPTKTAKRLRTVSEGFDWLGEVLPASEIEVRRWDALGSWQHKEPEPIKLRKYAEIKTNLDAAAAAWGDTLRGGTGTGLPPDLFDTLSQKCRRLQLREHRNMAHLTLAIPVAVYGGPRKLNVVYMSARAERVLYAYGNEDQRAVIEKQYAGRFQDRTKGLRILHEAFNWRVTPTSETLDASHTDVHKGGVPGWSYEGKSWLKTTLNANTRRQRGKQDRPGKKGDGKPSSHQVWVLLGLNRAFDELAGVGPILRRKFYKQLVERANRDTRFPFSSFGRDPDGSKAKAARLSILRERYTHKPVLMSSLVWSAEQGRSVAQNVFSKPLRAAGLLKTGGDDY